MWGSLSIEDEEDNTDDIFGSGLSKGGGGGGLWGNFEDDNTAALKKPAPFGKKNTSLFGDFNFNDDSELSIFDNTTFTTKGESLFPSLNTSDDQYNADNENLSNPNSVNNLATQSRTTDSLFPSLFDSDAGNANLNVKKNSPDLDIFSSLQDGYTKIAGRKRPSIFGTFDDKQTKPLVPPSSPLFGEVSKQKAGNINLFERTSISTKSSPGEENKLHAGVHTYSDVHHDGAKSMQRLWRGHSGRKEHFALLLDKHEEDEKARIMRERQQLNDGYALLDQLKLKQDEHHKTILERNKTFFDKNSDNVHSNDAYVDTQESEQYSDAWGERLAQKFKRCLHLKWNENEGELNLRKMFKKIDKNHDGKISRKEFHEVVDLLDIDFRDSEIRVLIEYLDKNDDGGIDLAEFKAFRNITSDTIENEIDESQLPNTVGLTKTTKYTSVTAENTTDATIEWKKKSNGATESIAHVH